MVGLNAQSLGQFGIPCARRKLTFSIGSFGGTRSLLWKIYPPGDVTNFLPLRVLCAMRTVNLWIISSIFASLCNLFGVFLHLFGLPKPSSSMEDVWASWWFKLRPCLRALEGVIVKVVVWHVWLTRNYCMFNAVSLSPHSVISKVAHVLILWFSEAPISQQMRFDEHASIICRSLAFSRQSDDSIGGATLSEEDSVQGIG